MGVAKTAPRLLRNAFCAPRFAAANSVEQPGVHHGHTRHVIRSLTQVPFPPGSPPLETLNSARYFVREPLID